MQPSLSRKIAAFSVIALMGATLGLTSFYYEHASTAQKEAAAALAAQTHHLPKLSIAPDSIEARAAIVYDPITGNVLFEKNAETQLPLASLTKLATARAVLSATNKNQVVVIQPKDITQEGDSGLHAGDVWKLADLIAFGLTTSSNDAMAAVADALPPTVAVSRMNQQAKDDHMPQSYYLNPTGLDVSSSTAGAYGSAKDVARLVEDLLREQPTIFEATTRKPKLSGDSGKGAQPTTEPIWDVPGLIAAKTGYTDLAGGNLAVAVDLGVQEPIIVVVLGSSRDGRFSDVRTLINDTRDALKQ